MDSNFVYTLLEVKYLKMFGREITYEFNANSDLFPYDWNQMYDNNLKIDILTEALTKKIKIVNTDAYVNNIDPNRLTR